VFAVFVGPSGCGKSTLLRLIAGLESMSGGEFRLDGRRMNEVPPDKRGIAMVFQSYALYPHMTVAENIGFSLDLKKVPKPEIRRQVAAVVEMLQLGELLERKPQALSGGQRQRVAIGRAIIKKPSVILFDEPLSNLDAALRVQMRAELQKLHRDLKATIIYVTHDQVEAMTMADRIVVLNKGTVAQSAAPIDLYHRPDNTFVAAFIGSPRMNLVSARAVEAGAAGLRLTAEQGFSIELAAGLPIAAGDELKIGIRPEHLRLARDGEAADIEAPVALVERLGVETYLSFGSVEAPLIARVEGDFAIRPGDRVPLRLDRNAIHLFDAAGRAIRGDRRAEHSIP
jgi:multiple sugar transport system ATP-binding protein